jgi:Holliday junction resolvasome RuvABC endonuclease subunit
MTQIIGVDGALADTGLAVWCDGAIAVRTIHTSPTTPLEDRWATIGGALWHIVTDDTIVALEGVFSGAKMAGTALGLAMLHGTLRLGLHYRQVPFVVIDNQAVKQYATGYGRATKREMIAACSRLRLGFEPGDDHQADALWLVAMTLDHYGAPMCAASEAGRQALARATWPTFSLIEPGLMQIELPPARAPRPAGRRAKAAPPVLFSGVAR